ncbi:MAG TPA: imidazolonepropionase [Chloroflexota bacterium]|nr:imidazolonepropionase [Chloroflexota bacterium]
MERDTFIVTNTSQLATAAERDIEGAQGPLRLIPDGALAARDGRIVWVGPRAAMPGQLADGGEVLDAGGRLVIPGFVDAHTHPIFAGLRAEEFCARALGQSYQELLARGDAGIMSTVNATRAATEDELLALATLRAAAFLRHGTTTIEAKTGYGLSPEAEEKSLRVLERLRERTPLNIVPTYLGAHLVPTEYRQDPEAYVRLLLDEMLPMAAGRVEFCDVFCDQGAFTVEQSRRILRRALDLGMPPRLHADELADVGAAVLAAELGAASADHLVYVEDRGMEAMARAGTVATLLPGTTFSLASDHYAPARRMVEHGLTLALATDCNPGTCYTENMAMVISLAVLKLKLTPEEALHAATMGGAYSLRRQREIGSLEEGKRCDLVVLDARTYHEIPYHFGVNLAHTTVVNGRVVYQAGPGNQR